LEGLTNGGGMHVNVYCFVIVFEMDISLLPCVVLMGGSLGLKCDNILKT
jgi:hypothetical protein